MFVFSWWWKLSHGTGKPRIWKVHHWSLWSLFHQSRSSKVQAHLVDTYDESIKEDCIYKSVFYLLLSHSLIHSLTQQLLSTYHIPDNFLGANPLLVSHSIPFMVVLISSWEWKISQTKSSYHQNILFPSLFSLLLSTCCSASPICALILVLKKSSKFLIYSILFLSRMTHSSGACHWEF